MHAYSEDYLLTAQRILGDMLDYAVNEYEFDPDEFYKMFLVSDVSRQFQEGNPTYIAGKNGCDGFRTRDEPQDQKSAGVHGKERNYRECALP